MPEIATDPPASFCNRLYPRLRFHEFQSLGLIHFCLVRAKRAGALRRETRAIRGDGHVAFPIPGGACPIFQPGR